MEDHIAYLKEVLRRYFDPATPPEQREELEGALTQFKLRPDGWKLAVYALQRESRGAGEGPYLIWFSASVLEETVRRSWPTIPEQDKAGLRDGLLQFILHAGGSLAPFAANKLAAVCSNIARLDWPQRQPNFLNVIEAALRSPATRPGALLVLSVALEQFEAVAPDFPGRDSGQVLWSRAEELQSLLSPVVPGVLAALTSALQGREREEDVLGALHTVLGGSRGGSHGSTLKQAAAGPGVGPLLDALFRLADPGRPSTSLPALRCLSLLADAALPRATAEPLQGLFLGGLTALCDRAGEGASEGWWLAASRLLALFLRRHLAAIGANEAMRPSLDALLQRSAALTFSSRDLTRVLVASEVWRAVCEALSTQQDEAWEATDPKAAEGAFFALAERLRGGLMNISDELMKGMMLGGGQGGAGGLSAASMDRGGGSGAAMEEALEEVSVASRLEAEGLENEEADGAGPEGDDNDSGRSEAEVYVDACEVIQGQLIALYPSEMVPRVLALFRSQIDALEGTPAVLPQARDLLTVLRLLSRCACHLQREGPGNEGASAVVSTTLQLAETWPVLRARVAWGDGPSAADRAGVQLYKVVAALAVVWLPGQGGEHEVVRQVWGSCLRSAASLARASSTIPPPVLTAGFEMLAVLTSMAVNMRELAGEPLPVEDVQSLLQAAPAVLLGTVSHGGQWHVAELRSLKRAGRALYLGLTDLLIRQCGRFEELQQQEAAGRVQVVLGPLVEVIEEAINGTTPTEVVQQVAGTLAALARVLRTASKTIRQAAYGGCFARAVHACVEVTSRCQEVMVSTDPGESASLPAAGMAEALQHLTAAVVDAFGGEMGASGVEGLLRSTIHIYSFEGQGGVNGWTLVCNGGRTGALLQVLSKCATRRCCSSAQVMATLGFLFELWDQILEGFSSTADEGQLRGRARGMKDLASDLGAAGSQVLSSTIYVLQENWRTFIRKPVDAPQGQGAVAATLAAMAARQTNTGASVYERQAQQAAASKEEALLQKTCGPDAPLRMLSMAAEFLEGASAQSSMAPSPHDVQAVLHALMDLEEKVSLSEAAELRPSLPNLLRGLMDLLHGWRFSTMEPDIIEALHIIALAEWQTFLDFLPKYVWDLNEVRYAGADKEQRAADLLGPLLAMGQDSHSFSRAMARFLNDSKYYQSQKIVVA